jgi:preprotein translocase subunit YajC
MSPEAIQQLLFFGLIALIFYFFMIRPQQKRAADQKTFRDALHKGQAVVTLGGLHGKVAEITDTTVTLEVDRNTRLTFEKASIASAAPGATTEAKA